jgi:predicted dehydrogenase
LIAHPWVEAVYLLSPQWFGLYPIELACRYAKPVYCALALAARLDELEQMGQLVRTQGIPFMPELPRRFYPATLRLRELIATKLGRPRLVIGQARLFGFDRYSDPGPTTQLSQTALAFDPGANLIDWCRFVFQEEPSSIEGDATMVLPDPESIAGPDFEASRLRFPSGGVAHIWMARYHQATWGEAARFLPQPGFQVYAERGAAWLEMPDRIQWSDDSGTHEERLPMEPTVGEHLSEHFRRMVRGEPSLAPTLDDALQVARLVQRLRESQSRGA